MGTGGSNQHIQKFLKHYLEKIILYQEPVFPKNFDVFIVSVGVIGVTILTLCIHFKLFHRSQIEDMKSFPMLPIFSSGVSEDISLLCQMIVAKIEKKSNYELPSTYKSYNSRLDSLITKKKSKNPVVSDWNKSLSTTYILCLRKRSLHRKKRVPVQQKLASTLFEDEKEVTATFNTHLPEVYLKEIVARNFRFSKVPIEVTVGKMISHGNKFCYGDLHLRCEKQKEKKNIRMLLESRPAPTKEHLCIAICKSLHHNNKYFNQRWKCASVYDLAQFVAEYSQHIYSLKNESENCVISTKNYDVEAYTVEPGSIPEMDILHGDKNTILRGGIGVHIPRTNTEPFNSICSIDDGLTSNEKSVIIQF